jgi:hypothetical protein
MLNIRHFMLERLLSRVDYLAAAIAFGLPRSILKLLDHAATSCTNFSHPIPDRR